MKRKIYALLICLAFFIIVFCGCGKNHESVFKENDSGEIEIDTDAGDDDYEQARTEQLGQSLIDEVYDLCEKEGQFAILSTTLHDTNQAVCIQAIKDCMENDSKYAELNLVEVSFGDDDFEKSSSRAQELLAKYPELECICAPAVTMYDAASEVLQNQNSSVKLTSEPLLD